MKIHHVGYLVKNIEKSILGFEELGYGRITEICRDDLRGIDIIFMRNDGYVIELVSPFRKDSVVSGMMKTHRNSPYHICYETDNIDEAINEFVDKGFVLMSDALPAVAIDGRKVCFLLNARIGMIELVECGE